MESQKSGSGSFDKDKEDVEVQVAQAIPGERESEHGQAEDK